MARNLFAAALALACLQSGNLYATLLFSVDPASPAIGLVPTTPSDILTIGPAVVVPEVALGLIPGDNLNALSFGNDRVLNPAMFGLPNINFSVDRISIGAPGSAVFAEALALEAAGDVFTTSGLGTNALYRDESTIPLLPGFFGDDLDALNLVGGFLPYFSIDALSPSNLGTDANDIFVGAFGALFASGEFDIGLDPFDDIDALALVDQGMIGVLDPGDRAYFSLTAFSPTTFTGSGGAYTPVAAGTPIIAGGVSPADILYTDFSGTVSLAADAPSIGLDPFDELNALSNPEPGSLALLACGLGGFAIYRRRQHKKSA